MAVTYSTDKRDDVKVVRELVDTECQNNDCACVRGSNMAVTYSTDRKCGVKVVRELVDMSE